MAVFRVNGGIINNQTLTGSLRYFKMAGPFAWAVSDGTVNLPVSTVGGETPVTYYFRLGDGQPVPNSAADLALREISKQCDITIIGLVPDADDPEDIIEVHFACSATGMGWGSDTPPYDVPPANADEDPTAAATQMQAAVRAIPDTTVYIGGASTQQTAPVSTLVSFAAVTVTEVPFILA